MPTLLISLLAPFCSCLRSRAAMHTEMLALRHQLAVLQRSNRRRPRLRVADRILWLGLSRFWAKNPIIQRRMEEGRVKQQSEFQKFDAVVRKILSVSHKELQRRETGRALRQVGAPRASAP